jgi:hypothetical protein
MAGIRQRLSRLERIIPASRKRFSVEFNEEKFSEKFLLYSELRGQQGDFDHEPDFPRALENYRNALAAAKACSDPPWDPPIDFHPSGTPHDRRSLWRTQQRFPEVIAGFWWLVAFWRRVQHGLPPVTETEFQELTDWFDAHDGRLYRLSLPSQLLELRDGKRISVGEVRHDLARGPRALRAGQVAEHVRQLRACYGEDLT